MNKYAQDLWMRASKPLQTAEADISVSSNAAASRAYYAAFYAVSALFALEGRDFTKHSAVQAAVHGDLVNTSRWRTSLGENYSYVLELRKTGDYGGSQHVKRGEAHEAIQAAKRVIEAVRKEHPHIGESK